METESGTYAGAGVPPGNISTHPISKNQPGQLSYDLLKVVMTNLEGVLRDGLYDLLKEHLGG